MADARFSWLPQEIAGGLVVVVFFAGANFIIMLIFSVTSAKKIRFTRQNKFLGNPEQPIQKGGKTMIMFIAFSLFVALTAAFCYASGRAELQRQEWHRRCRLDHLRSR